jgi:hypothetical protein
MKWAIGILAVSVTLNVYSLGQISRMKEVQSIAYQKDSLISNGYDELVIAYLNELKSNNLEIAKGQGKIEGIIAAALNFKPEENQHTAIWHAGYNRGSETAEYTRSVYYKEGYHKACEDLNCPAKFDEKAQDRKKKIEVKKEDEVEK